MRRQIAQRRQMTPSRRAPAVVYAFVFLLLTLAGEPARIWAQAPPDEYQVKAAFLFHFAQLVEWPAAAFTGNSQPLYLCLFDDEPSLRDFRSTIDGKLVADRAIRVRLLHQPQEVQGCNILFLSRDEFRRQRSLLNSVRNQPVLTVGETDDFLRDGGMIRFHLDGGRTRFDIDLASADSVRLRISSQLLLLATQVFRTSVDDHGGT